jgi:hypothetical protein
MPAQAILGDAATARPSLIPLNPTVRARPRAQDRTRARPQPPSAHGRRRLTCCSWPSGPRCWPTGTTSSRCWSPSATPGCGGARRSAWNVTSCSSLINVEWQLREVSGRFHRLPPKDDSYRSTNVEPLTPVDIPLSSPRCWPPGRQARTHGSSAPARRADVLCHGGSRPLSPPPPPQDLSFTQRVPCCGATKPPMSAADRRERCCSSFCGRHFRVSVDRLGQVRSPAVLFDGFAHFLSSSSERTDSVSSSQEPVNFRIPSSSRTAKTSSRSTPASATAFMTCAASS